MVELDTCEVLVLLSGGIDSSACLQFYCEIGRAPAALFVDYGQAAARLEATAAQSVAAYYSVPLLSLKWSGYQAKHAGLIPGRNSFLISAAVMERPLSVSIIAIGVHSGTDYPDCTQSFLDAMQSVLSVSENHSSWTKHDIIDYCRLRNVPLELTYSCERGTEPPCGRCLSCRDRSSFLAGASIRS
jgi:7-cyano-7-deazaguanine synthase